jgi:hypothetical protein
MKQKNQVYFLVFLLILIFSLSSKAQIKVGNGGGILENQFAYVWLTKQKYLDVCSQTDSCQLNQSEKSFLKIALTQLPQEQEFIIFTNDTKLPEIKDKFFWTEPIIGSQIYINSNKLYQNNSSGFQFSSFVFPIEQLTTAILYHQGMKLIDCENAAKKISQFWNQNITELKMKSIGLSEVGLNVIQSLDKPAQVLFSDSSVVYNITEELNKQLYCEGSFNKSIYQLNQLNWKQQTSIGQSTIAGEILYKCKQDNRYWKGDFEIDFTLEQNQQNSFERDVNLKSFILNLYQIE